MADRGAARLPMRWGPGDPEPDDRVTEVRTLTPPFNRWKRIKVRGWHPDYCWFNGDKTRWWGAVSNNYGPVFNTARLRRMHTMYGRRKRRG